MSARRKSNEPVTLARLELSRAVIARIVTRHGEAYLSIFERLDEECAKAAAKQSALDRVRQFASERQ